MTTLTSPRHAAGPAEPAPVAPGAQSSSPPHGKRPARLSLNGIVTALLAAATGWLSLQSWRGMADEPGRFLGPLALGALIVALVGWGVRRVTAGAWWALTAQLVVLTLWLVHRAAGGWPTPAAFARGARVLAEGAAAAQRYASPVSTDHPQFHFLLLAGGLGILVAVDLLCCGLRKATLAGLPLLLVITISASVLLAPVSSMLFLLTAVGWLTLVALQETDRVGAWGRGGGSSSFASVGWLSTRIGVTCAVIAVIFSGALSSEGRTFGNFGPGGNGGSINAVNPMLDLRRNLVQGKDVPLVRVETDDSAPAYLRTTVLDEFTGSVWQPSARTLANTSPVGGELPLPPGLSLTARGPSNVWRIRVEGAFATRWLPLPFPTTTLGVSDDWRVDKETMDVVATGGIDAGGLSYDATALTPLIDPSALRKALPPPAALSGEMTDLPNDMPAIFKTTAERVTKGATNDFDRAVLLQTWFRTDGGFRYSLKPAAGSGISTLQRFITTDRVGYCEQFAAAMAVMARALQIPARIAVGFLRSEPTGGGYVFSSRDLHSWPELYFEGVGWLKFEPTPQSRTDAPPSYTTQTLPDDPSALPSGPAASNTAAPVLKPRPAHDTTSGANPAAKNGSRPWLPVGVAVALLLALLLAPRLLRATTSRRRWTTARTPEALAEAAWTEVRATALDLGLRWSDRGTVRSNGRVVQRDVLPTLEARDAINQVMRFVELTRYARPQGAARNHRDLVQRDVATWREAMLRAVDQKRARRARWWPRSVTRSAVPNAREWLRALVHRD